MSNKKSNIFETTLEEVFDFIKEKGLSKDFFEWKCHSSNQKEKNAKGLSAKRQTQFSNTDKLETQNSLGEGKKVRDMPNRVDNQHVSQDSSPSSFETKFPSLRKLGYRNVDIVCGKILVKRTYVWEEEDIIKGCLDKSVVERDYRKIGEIDLDRDFRQKSKEDYWKCNCGSYHKRFPYNCSLKEEKQKVIDASKLLRHEEEIDNLTGEWKRQHSPTCPVCLFEKSLGLNNKC